jgi:transcriptional regulator with XRE-family HTH domain
MANAPSPTETAPRSFDKALGQNIREHRGARDLTQSQLADLIGLSRASVANIERGEQQVSARILARLTRALDVSADELMPDLRATAELPEGARSVKDLWENVGGEAQAWITKVAAGATKLTDDDSD